MNTIAVVCDNPMKKASNRIVKNMVSLTALDAASFFKPLKRIHLKKSIITFI